MRPRSVTVAVLLFLGSMLFGFAHSPPSLNAESILFSLVFVVLTFAFAQSVWDGRNWARWAMLIFFSVGLARELLGFDTFPVNGAVLLAIYIVQVVMQGGGNRAAVHPISERMVSSLEGV